MPFPVTIGTTVVTQADFDGFAYEVGIPDTIELMGDLSLAPVSRTSTTSVLIGTGTKTLTIATGVVNFLVNHRVRISSSASPANYMDGVISSYNPANGSLGVSVDYVSGLGTLASWNVILIPGGTVVAPAYSSHLASNEASAHEGATGKIDPSFSIGVSQPTLTTPLDGLRHNLLEPWVCSGYMYSTDFTEINAVLPGTMNPGQPDLRGWQAYTLVPETEYVEDLLTLGSAFHFGSSLATPYGSILVGGWRLENFSSGLTGRYLTYGRKGFLSVAGEGDLLFGASFRLRYQYDNNPDSRNNIRIGLTSSEANLTGDIFNHLGLGILIEPSSINPNTSTTAKHFVTLEARTSTETGAKTERGVRTELTGDFLTLQVYVNALSKKAKVSVTQSNGTIDGDLIVGTTYLTLEADVDQWPSGYEGFVRPHVSSYLYQSGILHITLDKMFIFQSVRR